MSAEVISLSLFTLFIIILLIIDLGVFNKKSHAISFKESLFFSVFWILLALGFYYVITRYGHWIHGIETIEDITAKIKLYHHPIRIDGLSYEDALTVYQKNLGLEYLTGYLIEKALSIDNIFVIVLIFTSFGVKPEYYHRILFWGIFGAIVMRFIFIFFSALLIQQFSWVLYIFGLMLIYSGYKMYQNRNNDEKIDTSEHPVVKLASRYFRIEKDYVGQRFTIRKNKKLYFTPLFLVLLVIEFTDVIFAIDSVPAIFSVTEDPYIVFFSNIFAIIGLRSLFFLLASMINVFHFLKPGLSILLVYIGIKLLTHDYLDQIGFKTEHSLYIIVAILAGSILLSVIFPKKKHNEASDSNQKIDQ